MEENNLIVYLMEFGLSRPEALIYLCLSKNGEMTGYEAAKETGISRSNVYNALAGLHDKGAAYMLEGNPTKYSAVDVEEFCENTIRKLNEDKLRLKQSIPKKREDLEGYLTIQGYQHIKDKAIHMISSCEKRLYIAAESKIIKSLLPELKEVIQKGLKTVVITDELLDIPGSIFYQTKLEAGQIRLITDSSYVLTGDMTESDSDTCLYSGQSNLVTVFKESLRNMITLIQYEVEKESEE